MHDKRQKMYTKFQLENVTGKDNLRNPGTDGRLTLKWLLKKKHDRIHLIHLAKNTI